MVSKPVLDRYQLLKVIGAGGFSTVYEAIDERFDTSVAIKVLADNHASNPDMRERFIAEAQLLRRLAGIPTVAVYDLGETDSGQPFAVMALADGDLAERVKGLRAKKVAIGPVEIDRVIEDLTRSLGALHAKGIVHRDVKPMNLLVFGDNEEVADTTLIFDHAEPAGSDNRLLGDAESLRLADLGFAKDLAEQSGLTVGGGTPGFMPPEQARPGQVDIRADIYAATAVVAWLITGRAPIDKSAEALEPAVVELLGPTASARGLLCGMADRPADRPDTMAQWQDLMTETLIDPPAPPAPPVPPVLHRGRGSVGSTAAVVAGVVGVIGGLLGGQLLGGFLGDDDSAVVSEAGVSIEISGPDQIQLGDTVSFTGEVTGAAEAQWVAPDGSLIDGEAPLTLQASRLGQGTVKLMATSADGQVVEATAVFEVVDDG